VVVAVVELRCPAGHLVGKLDLESGIVQTACRPCSYEARRLVVHWFAVSDGASMETYKPLRGELGDDAADAADGVIHS